MLWEGCLNVVGRLPECCEKVILMLWESCLKVVERLPECYGERCLNVAKKVIFT